MHCRQRQEAIAKRKDAKLAHVIISERYDKKASKYGTPSVPFPFNAKEVYERSMRQPLGRDYNTDSSFRCLPGSSVCHRRTLPWHKFCRLHQAVIATLWPLL